MIITVHGINGKEQTSIETYSTYAQERAVFAEKCEALRVAKELINGNGDEQSLAYLDRNPDSVIFRSCIGHPEADIVHTDTIVTHVPNSSLVRKNWRWEDREIENSQGGTTHLKGWHLE